MLHQQRNIAESFPERRHGDGKNVQTIVKVLAKPSFGNFFLQIPAGQSKNAHINPDGPGRTKPFEFSFLDCPEKFGLQIKRKFRKLIENQRSLVGQLKAADLHFGGSGIGALFPAE